jgi:hypothetical protein
MTQDFKKILKFSLLGIFFLLIVVYGFFRSQDLVFGIKIRDINIQDGQTFTESAVLVTGNAKNAVNLSLNGRTISIDKGGNFTETIALLSGYNVISLEAADKFGNTDRKNYKLIYKKP